MTEKGQYLPNTAGRNINYGYEKDKLRSTDSRD